MCVHPKAGQNIQPFNELLTCKKLFWNSLCMPFQVKTLVYEAKHHQKSSQSLMMFALPYSPLCAPSHFKRLGMIRNKNKLLFYLCLEVLQWTHWFPGTQVGIHWSTRCVLFCTFFNFQVFHWHFFLLHHAPTPISHRLNLSITFTPITKAFILPFLN